MTGPPIRLVPDLPAPARPAPPARRPVPRHEGRVVVHLAARPEDVPRVAAVTWAIRATGAFDQLVLLTGAARAAEPTLDELAMPALVHGVAGSGAGLADALGDELAPQPGACLLLYSAGHDAAAAALVAARRDLGVVWLAGPGAGERSVAAPVRLVRRLADHVLARTDHDADALRARCGAERLHVVGDPLLDAVRRCRREATARAVWRRHGLSRHGYLLAVLSRPETTLGAEPALRVPTVVGTTCAQPGALDLTGFVDRLSLAGGAAAIATDSEDVRDEAAALGVSCHVIGDDPGLDLAGPAPVALPGAGSSERVAAVVVANFARVSLV